MLHQWKYLLLLSILPIILSSNISYSQVQIDYSTISSGGTQVSNSGYVLNGTLGEVLFDKSINSSNQNYSGFWYVIKQADKIPPVIVVITEPIILWPANHQYENIDINQLFISISDNRSFLTINDVYIASVSSDEEEDAPGNGDGNTLQDIIISEDCNSLLLRKERQGNGNGRVYMITLAADDRNGNTGTVNCYVNVPHSKNGNQAIDDGALYTVDGICNSLSKTMTEEIDNNQTPQSYDLKQNFPNPFNPTTQIVFAIPKAGNVTLKVYNITGQLLKTLIDEDLKEGYHQVTWDATDSGGNRLSSGVYFYRITAGSYSKVCKMILLK